MLNYIFYQHKKMDIKTLILPILAILLFITQTSIGTKESYTNFIKTKCNITTKPTLCENTNVVCLYQEKQLRIHCRETLTVAIKGSCSTGVTVSNLEKKKGISKYDVGAFRGVEAVKTAEHELRKTYIIIGHLNGAEDKESQHHNAILYTSLVLTNVQTFIYGFDELEEKSKLNFSRVISTRMSVIIEISSKALSLITYL